MVDVSSFPIYLEIEVGGKSAEELVAELEANNIVISSDAEDIMSQDQWKPGEKEIVQFARVKVRDLGFTNEPTTAQIWARIKELGYSLCKPGDGPAIRLALKNQPRGDTFTTAMEQITDFDDRPLVYWVWRDVEGKPWNPWLDASWKHPDHVQFLDDEVVFRFRKQV